MHLPSFCQHFNLQETLQATCILFAVLDLLGSIPLFIKLKTINPAIKPLKITVASLSIMVIFTFAGEFLLALYDISVMDFAAAGSCILIGFAIELLLNKEIFRLNTQNTRDLTIVPITFPIITGPGCLTTLLVLKAKTALINLLIAIVCNLPMIYIVLGYLNWVEEKIGPLGLSMVRKLAGSLLLAMSLKTLKSYFCGN